jgi:DNA-binding transcriptional ArsR family regulator
VRHKDTLRAQYHARKAAGLCVDCARPLDRDGARCMACQERQRPSKLRYRRRNAQRLRDESRERSARLRAANPEKYNAMARARRLDHKLRGLCTMCSDDALEDDTRCAFHREVARAKTLNWWRKKTGKRTVKVPRREPTVPMPTTRDVLIGLVGWLQPKPTRQLVEELRERGIEVARRNIERHLANLLDEGVLERIADDYSGDVGYILAREHRRAA